MRIVLVTAEAQPRMKTGGLGDVLGHDVARIVPPARPSPRAAQLHRSLARASS